jgi:hypothetical protein
VQLPRVLLYGRPRCHLCDEARTVILGVLVDVPFDLEEIDIDEDDELVREYGIRIPVVMVDGVERFEYRVDPDELRRVLRP